MISQSPVILYSILSPEYFESIEQYKPSDEYRSIIGRYAEESWNIKPNGFWTVCSPGSHEPLQHGWKIHVSATPQSAVDTLERLVPILARDHVQFKFCSDSQMLHLSINKNWDRTGAGKFMTIYPRAVDQFKSLIEEIYQVTQDLKGPYILSDRPYKDSRVIFYRYGEHTGVHNVDSYGNMVRSIQAPNGEWITDERVAYFRLPSWVEDPFTDTELPKPPGSDGVLLGDRYQVKMAQKFSATGGIYIATDTHTDQTVVIREARPMLGGLGDRTDTFGLMEKEARILKKLGPTGYLPQFVDLFQEWEHLFLVQEKLDAESLWGYAINFTYKSEDTTPGQAFEQIRAAIRLLVDGLQTVHDHDVVLRDLTKTNVMVTEADEVKFIDLEFAYELDRDDPPVMGWTTGYASPQQLSNKTPTPQDDHYALGALILDMIAFTATGFELNRAGILASLRVTLDDLRLPQELHDVVTGLTDVDPGRRWGMDRVIETLDKAPVPTNPERVYLSGDAPLPRAAPEPELITQVQKTLEGVTDFILSKADYSRQDRLWPASAEVFATNPMHLQYGAAGTAYFLWRATGKMAKETVNWILQSLRTHPCPPGLYSGLSGVAVFLLELGLEEPAKQVLAAAAEHTDLIYNNPSLYYGSAGWGLANLHFWRTTGEQAFLDQAFEVAQVLLDTAQESEEGTSWTTDGMTVLGLGQGQSGTATFLLTLNAAQADEKILETAVRAVDFEIIHREEVGDHVLWFPHTESGAGEPKSPSMRFGSAGVETAVLRCFAATGDPKYRKFADLCAYTVAQRNTNKLWQDFGMAGFGELLLDMYSFLGDEKYLHNAFYLAEGLLPHRIVKDEGVAFAGSELYRISCDYGMGSAGVGMFLHRLLNPQTPRLLMLDELFAAERPTAPPMESAVLVG